jgi:hypothetical protein
VGTDVQVYFCDPQSPWQRGSNENTNGLLRQYLPKKSDLSQFTQSELDEIALRLNQRPRKRWDFKLQPINCKPVLHRPLEITRFHRTWARSRRALQAFSSKNCDEPLYPPTKSDATSPRTPATTYVSSGRCSL